jgi:hypothetical protein
MLVGIFYFSVIIRDAHGMARESRPENGIPLHLYLEQVDGLD